MREMNTIIFTFLGWILNIKLAFAASAPGSPDISTTPGSPLIPTGGSSQTLPNPLGEGTTITGLITRIAGYLFGISLSVAVIMILYGAFQMLTSAGDPTKFQNGKKTIIYALIGVGVVLIAGGLPVLIGNLLTGGNSTTLQNPYTQ